MMLTRHPPSRVCHDVKSAREGGKKRRDDKSILERWIGKSSPLARTTGRPNKINIYIDGHVTESRVAFFARCVQYFKAGVCVISSSLYPCFLYVSSSRNDWIVSLQEAAVIPPEKRRCCCLGRAAFEPLKRVTMRYGRERQRGRAWKMITSSDVKTSYEKRSMKWTERENSLPPRRLF